LLTVLPTLLLAVFLSSPPQSIAHTLDAAARGETVRGFSGVVLVARGDSVILERAYGLRARLGTSRRFWIGSMTKGFTAAAILELESRGRLHLDDSLSRFFPGAPADKKAITIRQLLTHTAGIAGRDAGAGQRARARTVEAILSNPLEYTPGQGYRYIDDDYELLAAIVEVASGTSWEAFVQQHVLRSRGLGHTGFWHDRHADDWAHKGANGMSSTARDLYHWVTGSPHTWRITNAAPLDAPRVFVRHDSTADVHYGFGARVYVRGDSIVELMHSGASDEDHTAIARLFPNGLTVIVLSDAGRTGQTTWASRVAAALVAATR
jgi:CubicO group peptidase (beta-lactamase class C family)